MTLLALLDAHLAFGDQPLLDGAQLQVREGERIGLIGRNGTGKSALLHVIAGRSQLDSGEVQLGGAPRVVFVEQEPGLPPAPTLRESLQRRGGLAAGDGHGSSQGPVHDDPRAWRTETRLTEFMQRLGLDPARDPATCSGGERKRAALALAFALEPDLLLLDEPTNHLDIAGIDQLEVLVQRMLSVIVVTHDRAFLDHVVTRIVELDRGVLRSFPGNFAAYEARKEEQLAAEEVANRRFDKFWAQEEVWIRKGVEARRTRNEGRVKRLERLREERDARREQLGRVQLHLDAGERSGRLVAELVGVCKRFGDRPIVQDLSLRLMRGDRLGLIGPNGAGKSTLIRLILGQLEPDAGEVKLGTNLRVAYFDQMREQLDPEKSVAETISPGSDWVEVNGQRRHIASYLADFLFSPRRAGSPVKSLSGGERNRLLLARLFARPANLLVLDEPTNDLDIESLELLEQTLQEYPGTLLLVSHDRRFLDEVVTQTRVAEGAGAWREYVGGYTDWLEQRPAQATPPRGGRAERDARPARDDVPPTAAAPREKSRARMSWKAQRELEALPGEIDALEREQAALVEAMSRPDYHARGPAEIAKDGRRASEIEALLIEKFARWEELEAERAKLGGG